MRKLFFKLGIQRIVCAFLSNADFLEWEARIKKILCYFSQKKITNSKTPSKFKLSKELFSSRNLKNIKISVFHNHFSPELDFLNNYILASLEMHFSLI